MTRLQQERERLHLSRRAIAQASATGEAQYSRLDSGRSKPYRPEAERIFLAMRELGYSGDAASLFDSVAPASNPHQHATEDMYAYLVQLRQDVGAAYHVKGEAGLIVALDRIIARADGKPDPWPAA